MADDVPEVVRHLMQPVREPVLAFSEQDLAGAKTRFISHFVHARETYQGIANQLGRSAFVYGDPNYGAQYIAAVEALTRDDLQQAADTFFTPQRANIALLMPTHVPLPDTATVLDWAQGEENGAAFTPPLSPLTRPSLPRPGGGTLIVQTDLEGPAGRDSYPVRLRAAGRTAWKRRASPAAYLCLGCRHYPAQCRRDRA